MAPMLRWHVAQILPRGERAALTNLARQGFEGYLPVYQKRRRHARRVDVVDAPLFPGYLFVRFDPEFCRWRAISSTIGVRSLICHGDTPVQVPEGIVEEIRKREDGQGHVILDQRIVFKEGEAVRIIRGALTDCVGLFCKADDQDRIFILLDLMGRRMRVRLSAEDVCSAAA